MPYQPAVAHDPNWYPDTGATHHMTCDPRPLQNSAPYAGPNSVILGNDDHMKISHTGNISLPLGTSNFHLSNVFHIPHMHKDLLLVARFTQDNNVLLTFDANQFCIYDNSTGAPLFQGQCKDCLYPIPSSSLRTIPLAFAAMSLPSSICYNRLDHPSHKILSYLGSNKLLSSDFKFQKSFCQGCALGKSTHLPFSSNNEISALFPFALVHSDVWQSPVLSVTGYKYYVIFTDDFTRYTWFYPMRQKSEVFSHLKTFLASIQNHFAASLKSFQSDGEGEFVNSSISELCKNRGIHHRFSCPHTPEQNGLAERKLRHISEMAYTLLVSSGVPLKYWVEAMLTSVYLINRLPTPVLQWNSPFSRLFGRVPYYSDLRTFGCACYPYLGAYLTNKLLPRTVECVFLGYSSQHKGFRCLDPTNNKIYISRHVRFNETYFPFSHGQTTPQPT
ncbi:hypothetical protein L3X38_037965 [Prunus dulcis]|uniref:Integrase catalytic domain-containing protein n=1 Tax=Prunus dulcis TaxID=3755 RepID=A0AAD4V6G9_PRUDU|nr:hypothetical protein L3X38_037965 [Prunus dulcis]